MPLLTIVEHYVMAAMQRAVEERMENGIIGATIPECPGVIAFGADAHECSKELYARLVDWVKVSLAAGNPLPVIDGIDLNTDANRILATYHQSNGTASSSEYFEDEDGLEAAFEAHSRPA